MRIKILETNATLSGEFKMRTLSPQNGHLFVRFKTKTEVLTKNGYEYAAPGDFMFYNANEVIEYNSIDKCFNHDYFRFFLSKDEEKLFTVPTSVLFNFPMSEKLENIFSLIADEYYSVSDIRDESVNLLGSLFLISAHEYVKQTRFFVKMPHRNELFKLRTEILGSPQTDYKIDELAKSVHMSPSYFQKSYKKLFGTSCINDIIHTRIKKAAYLLNTTDKTEAEIAELCGYNSTEHFIRQFKKVKGSSPSKFKKNNTIAQ